MTPTAELLETLYDELLDDVRAAREVREQIDEVLAVRCACV
jgi:hypothetical protein